MPEHIHLLLSETERETLDVAIKSLTQAVSRRVIVHYATGEKDVLKLNRNGPRTKETALRENCAR